MSVYFVTRHPGAREWAQRSGIAAEAILLSHLDPAILRPGDRVIGSLPVNLVAQVCALGGCYLHLSLDLPEDLRGRELSAEEMARCGATVEAFQVVRLDCKDSGGQNATE